MEQELTKEKLDAADGKIEGTKEWAGASTELQEQKQDEARSVNEFSDWEELNGVRIYAPTKKHYWAIAAFAQTENDVINAMVGGYILGTPGPELNKLFVENANGTLQSNALEFSSQFNLDQLGDAIERLFDQGQVEVDDGEVKNS